MTPHTMNRPPCLALAGILSLVLLAGCVSEREYDEMSELALRYQRSAHEMEQYQQKLEADNRRMTDELALYQGHAPIEAGYTADIDQRLAELRTMLQGAGSGPDEVTLFEVEGGWGFSMRDSILFDSGSEEVRPAGREVLLAMARDIAAKPFQRLWVRGHTDSDPISKPATAEKYPMGNLQLSAARAVRVASLLAAEGKLDRSRICVAGFGSNEPIAPNADSTGKQKNRRVEVFVIEDPKAAGSTEPERKDGAP